MHSATLTTPRQNTSMQSSPSHYPAASRSLTAIIYASLPLSNPANVTEACLQWRNKEGGGQMGQLSWGTAGEECKKQPQQK